MHGNTTDAPLSYWPLQCQASRTRIGPYEPAFRELEPLTTHDGQLDSAGQATQKKTRTIVIVFGLFASDDVGDSIADLVVVGLVVRLHIGLDTMEHSRSGHGMHDMLSATGTRLLEHRLSCISTIQQQETRVATTKVDRCGPVRGETLTSLAALSWLPRMESRYPFSLAYNPAPATAAVPRMSPWPRSEASVSRHKRLVQVRASQIHEMLSKHHRTHGAPPLAFGVGILVSAALASAANCLTMESLAAWAALRESSLTDANIVTSASCDMKRRLCVKHLGQDSHVSLVLMCQMSNQGFIM